MLNTVLKSSLNQCRLALQIAVYRLHNYANKCFAVWWRFQVAACIRRKIMDQDNCPVERHRSHEWLISVDDDEFSVSDNIIWSKTFKYIIKESAKRAHTVCSDVSLGLVVKITLKIKRQSLWINFRCVLHLAWNNRRARFTWPRNCSSVSCLKMETVYKKMAIIPKHFMHSFL